MDFFHRPHLHWQISAGRFKISECTPPPLIHKKFLVAPLSEKTNPCLSPMSGISRQPLPLLILFRVTLKVPDSFLSLSSDNNGNNCLSTWHFGFSRHSRFVIQSWSTLICTTKWRQMGAYCFWGRCRMINKEVVKRWNFLATLLFSLARYDVSTMTSRIDWRRTSTL